MVRLHGRVLQDLLLIAQAENTTNNSDFLCSEIL